MHACIFENGKFKINKGFGGDNREWDIGKNMDILNLFGRGWTKNFLDCSLKTTPGWRCFFTTPKAPSRRGCLFMLVN
jgi:hypothetical protein